KWFGSGDRIIWDSCESGLDLCSSRSDVCGGGLNLSAKRFNLCEEVLNLRESSLNLCGRTSNLSENVLNSCESPANLCEPVSALYAKSRFDSTFAREVNRLYLSGRERKMLEYLLEAQEAVTIKTIAATLDV